MGRTPFEGHLDGAGVFFGASKYPTVPYFPSSSNALQARFAFIGIALLSGSH